MIGYNILGRPIDPIFMAQEGTDRLPQNVCNKLLFAVW